MGALVAGSCVCLRSHVCVLLVCGCGYIEYVGENENAELLVNIRRSPARCFVDAVVRNLTFPRAIADLAAA